MFSNPPPDSLVVEVATEWALSHYQRATLSDKGLKKLDFRGRKMISIGLPFCVTNYQPLSAKYDFNGYSRLADFIDKLPMEDRAQFQSLFIERRKLVAKVAPQATVDAADTASISLATGLVMRRNSWLQSSRIPRKVQNTIQE